MYEIRVARGIPWLDKTYGQDWYQKIDLNTLNIADGSRCILAQLNDMHSYFNAVHSQHLSDTRATDYGFILHLSMHFETYTRKLTDAWVLAITRLKLERGDPATASAE